MSRGPVPSHDDIPNDEIFAASEVRKFHWVRAGLQLGGEPETLCEAIDLPMATYITILTLTQRPL